MENNFEQKNQPDDKEAIVSGLKERIRNIYKKDLIKGSELIGGYVKNLREKYPDYEDFLLYHTLVGSSPAEKGCPKFDFPGDDSVRKFIQDTFDDFIGEKAS